jgi:hypothetical protein
MGFANPIWLWGLSGLLVPLAIHLLSRKEGTVIPIGSLRHLQDSNTQQFKSLRLNEILLLILRCLLIMLIVFFLSGFQWSSTSQQKWVLVEENLKGNPRTKALLDSLKKDGHEFHSLSQGFPITENTNQQPINYWQLIEELKSKGLSNAVIISSARIESFKGQRVAKGNLKWITIPAPSREYLLFAKTINSDSVTARIGFSKNGNTHYSTTWSKKTNNNRYFKIKEDSVQISSVDTLKVWLLSDKDLEYDRKIMLASLRAIEKFVSSKLIIVEETTDLQKHPGNNDWLIWLSEKQVPTLNTVGKIFYKNLADHKILEPQSAKEWALTTRLDQDKTLDQNLSLQLSQILFPAKEEWSIANLKDQRIMPEQMMWASQSEGTISETERASLLPIERPLLLLILILLLIERFVSYRRNQ